MKSPHLIIESASNPLLLVEMLHKKDLELAQTRMKLVESNECITKKDKELAQTLKELAKKDIELAKKDTELAKRDLAIVELWAEKCSALVHNHHNSYYQMTYAIHMTPWGIDPASPTYEGAWTPTFERSDRS